MAQANAARRAQQWVVLLLAAVLTAISLYSANSGEPSSSATRPAGDIAASVQQVDATTPAGPFGRPAAAPSVLCTSSPAELLPFGVTPSALPPSALARLGLQHRTVTPPPYAARRPAAGDRAPPSDGRTT